MPAPLYNALGHAFVGIVAQVLTCRLLAHFVVWYNGSVYQGGKGAMSEDLLPYVDAPHQTLEVLAVRPPAPPPRNRLALIVVTVALMLAIPAGLYVGATGNAVGGGAAATPTPAGGVAATSATITFARVTGAIAAPRTTLVAATDGSGQIRATSLHVSLHAVTSLPIDAPLNVARKAYVVPPGCGDHQPAYDAAFQGVKYQLDSRSPGGTVVFAGPDIGFDDGSFFCFPTARRPHRSPSPIANISDGFGFHAYYALVDAQNYQIAQMQATVPAHEVVLAVQTCTGVPKMTDASAARVTILCPTTGTAGWDWPPAALSALAQRVVGLTPTAARQLLGTLPGIVPGSLQIALSNGSLLPGDAGAMTVQLAS